MPLIGLPPPYSVPSYSGEAMAATSARCCLPSMSPLDSVARTSASVRHSWNSVGAAFCDSTANFETSPRNRCTRSKTVLKRRLPSLAHFSALWYWVLNGVSHDVLASLRMAFATTDLTDCGALLSYQSVAAL